jgi:hypothetical protein
MEMQLSLTPHPSFPPPSGRKLQVDIQITGSGTARLTYRLGGALPTLAEPVVPARTDELWRTTCFELFVRPQGGEGYAEFNFSPSTRWAAYAFDGYRAGMRDLPLDVEPVIRAAEPEHENGYGIEVEVDLSAFPQLPLMANITAVIEERDGSKSYWAIAHAPDKPDFHHPDCFVLQLPAPDAS